MGTPFSSIAILFWSMVFFFVSPSFISSDKGVYEDGLKNFQEIPLPGVIGPESIAFDCDGKGPYVGVSDGRILRWEGQTIGWTEFAVSSPNRDRKLCDGSTNSNLEPKCGRPLGLKFNPATCDLYVADAYFGLHVVGPSGGVAKQLATSAEGIPFRFLNGLDVDPKTGVVYFTDSSIYFQRKEYLLAIISADKTGRLLKYDPHSKKVTVLFEGLGFPNGVALSKDSSFLLLAESSTMKILNFSLVGSKISAPELFAQLGRIPDNIKRDAKGDFWVALNSGRGAIRRLHQTSSFRNEIEDIPWFEMDPFGVKFAESGDLVEVLDGKDGKAFDSVSEIEEDNQGLWMGSSAKPYVGYIKT